MIISACRRLLKFIHNFEVALLFSQLDFVIIKYIVSISMDLFQPVLGQLPPGQLPP